jgi:hypothetical protein
LDVQPSQQLRYPLATVLSFRRPSPICDSERSEESAVRHSGARNLKFYNQLFRCHPKARHSSSDPGGCCRICARVLRFQIATAIPPRAAEVASNNPVRQKFFCSGAGGIQPDAWSMGIGSLRKGINFRKGTVTWEKN